jgi:hypothetical protein
LNENLNAAYNKYANELLETFVKRLKEMYGYDLYALCKSLIEGITKIMKMYFIYIALVVLKGGGIHGCHPM